MRFAFKKSLYIKQSFTTLLLAIVLSIVLSCLQAIETLRSEPARIDQEFQGILSLVEQPLAHALFRLDRAFAQQQAESLLYHPAIQAVEILDEEGQRFAYADASHPYTQISDTVLKWLLPNELMVERALYFSGIEIKLGRIQIDLDRRYLLDGIIASNSQFFIHNLLKDILLASLISLLFYGLVTRPVKQLTYAISQVDGSEEVPVPKSFDRIHKQDELGRLKSTFNQLLSRLNMAMAALERSHQHSKAMIDHAADGILVVNRNNRIIRSNAAVEKMTSLTQEQLRETSLSDLHGDNLWLSLDELLSEMRVDDVMTVETTFSPMMSPIPVEIRIAKYFAQDDFESVMLVRDLSERKEAQQRINRLAYYDSLTRLPNRTMIVERLKKRMESLEAQETGALVMLDLDRFKTINDSLGHNVGDQLLVSVVEALLHTIPSDVVFARMGGDEFAFLWSSVKGARTDRNVDLVRFVQDVLNECSKAKHVAGHELHVTASIGVSFFDGTEESPATILRQADTALYRAKETGRNTFAFFQQDMQEISDRRLLHEKSLHRAVSKSEFEVYYQPQNDAEGAIIGAEALLRWHDPEHGFIPPDEFIPLAEEIGLIHDIGSIVFNQAARQVAKWLEEGVWQEGWRISINVSPLQFLHPNLLADIDDALRESGLPASAIDIEITENVLMADSELALEKMAQIRKLGIHLSIDDFGTGYSSLKYLKSLPIDRLKIDQSFVRDLINDPSDRAIVMAIIAMADALDVNVLAEGVETQAHLDQLKSMRCFTYQGYFFGRPMPAAQFVELCNKHQAHT
ncbi:GGDEF domain-containing protein [Marinomonas piezotolerans]|uniref:cyclic-guanylate-specific phosphodiesterase n=1 Tax=Marinomonas piezotolerans TaxID=2213058 RepID=A0A370U5N9_9GAMM|nr:EAL domain-containing protein [Marinomonas piezotolerans]RDL43081.1 GGDEF domain-containing protein [Marinomonas piezotolerans]